MHFLADAEGLNDGVLSSRQFDDDLAAIITSYSGFVNSIFLLTVIIFSETGGNFDSTNYYDNKQDITDQNHVHETKNSTLNGAKNIFL